MYYYVHIHLLARDNFFCWPREREDIMQLLPNQFVSNTCTPIQFWKKKIGSDSSPMRSNDQSHRISIALLFDH